MNTSIPHGFVRVLVAALMVTALAPGSSTAQERVTIRGQVVDSESREPLPGVLVTALLPDVSVLTDSIGGFEFSMIRDREYDMLAEDMGYYSVRITLREDAPETFSIVLLEPDKELLAGLAVLHDRLEQRRRRRSGSRLEIIEHDELMVSELQSGYLFLQRNIAMARRCERRTEDLCTPSGSSERAIRICVDDVRPPAGASELESYDPSDLWVVEIYGNGSSVRVYSRWWVDRMARTRQGEITLVPTC